MIDFVIWWKNDEKVYMHIYIIRNKYLWKKYREKFMKNKK